MEHDDLSEEGEHEHNASGAARDVGRDVRRHDAPAAAAGGSGAVEHRSGGVEEYGREHPEHRAEGFEFQPTLSSELEYTRGNIPPPSMLKGYGDVDPAYPGIIMRMAQAEAASRVHARAALVTAESRAVTWAAGAAVVVPVLALVLGFVALLLGHPSGAWLGFGVAALTGLARVISAARGSQP